MNAQDDVSLPKPEAGEEQSLNEAAAATGFDVEDLPVSLVFVAGEMEVALGDLQGLAPGQVLDLRRPVEAHVEVRANGRTIGRGELVEIDGRVGVRMLELRTEPPSRNPSRRE